MNQTISLNGMWELGYCELGCGIRPPFTLRCPVPGDVHMAFLDAGMIREPLVDENTLDCHFLESKEFWYRRTFTAPSVSCSARKILTFHGLDCTADIWLNEVYLGRHNDAFIEAEYDVSSVVTSGENTLVIRIDSGTAEAKKHPLDDMDKMWNADQPYRVLMRKPQFVYGWDWTPWLETCGIWRDVTLTVYEQAAMTDIHIHQPDSSVPVENDTVTIRADITLDTVLEGDYSISATVYGDTRYDTPETAAAVAHGKDSSATSSGHSDIPRTVSTGCVHVTSIASADKNSSALDSGLSTACEAQSASAGVGSSVLSCHVFPCGTACNPGTVTCSLTLTVPIAKLWWSNGLGNPYLYKIEFTLYAPDKTPVQTVTQDYGIRSISLREEPISDTERGFTFVLNGVPVFCKGANHVPADCLIGRITDEKTTALVDLAADSHMNMLRVWGGGFYESEAFMRACDRRGIMVWHDFMFACGYYPDHDPAFISLVTDEAVRAVTRLRRHSSLIGWSGNNEIQEMYRGMMTYDPLSRPYGMKLFQEVLPAIVNKYCPNLIYRESSPFGGDDPAGSLCGDQHIWHFTHRPQFEHYLDLVHFTDFPIKFLSEFGIIGAMSLESTKRALPSLWKTAQGANRNAPCHDADTAELSCSGTNAEVLSCPDSSTKIPSHPDQNAAVSSRPGSNAAIPSCPDSNAGEPDRESAAWLHHCNTSSEHRILELVMSAYFPHTKEMGIQEYLLKSQALQAELTKYLYEEFRRRKFVCSGLLFWTLSDSWGIHNWSLIDYYLDQKPIYYALARAMRPIAVSIKGYCPQSFEGMRDYRDYYAGNPDALEIWLSNDTLQKENLRIRYTICLFDGSVLQSGEQQTMLPENVSIPALTVPIRGLITAPEQTVMHAEVYRGDQLLSDADYLFAPYKKLALTPAVISYRIEEIAGSGDLRLTLHADRFVWMLHIGGTDRLSVSDNDFHMLPDRDYTVTVRPATASYGNDNNITGSCNTGTCSADLRHVEACSANPVHTAAFPAAMLNAKDFSVESFVPQLHSAGAEPTVMRE